VVNDFAVSGSHSRRSVSPLPSPPSLVTDTCHAALRFVLRSGPMRSVS